MATTKMSKRVDFNSLFVKALSEWPATIKFSALRRYDSSESYTVDGLSDLADELEWNYIGSPYEILMRHLHNSIYVVILRAAANCYSVKLSQLRKEAIRSNFEPSLKASKDAGWTDKDRIIIKRYFKETGQADKRNLDNIKNSANSGSAAAKFNVGQMYYWGNGVAKSYVTAVKWYRRSAEQGHKKAQHALGIMYERGLGVKKSYKNAFFWYRIWSPKILTDHVLLGHLTSKQIADLEKRVKHWQELKRK